MFFCNCHMKKKKKKNNNRTHQYIPTSFSTLQDAHQEEIKGTGTTWDEPFLHMARCWSAIVVPSFEVVVGARACVAVLVPLLLVEHAF